MKTGRSLRELFSFPGFVAAATLKGVFGDPKARIVSLRRRKKRPFARIAAIAAAAATTSACAEPETCVWPVGACTLSSSVGESTAPGVAACM
jgi:hypothetical protein